MQGLRARVSSTCLSPTGKLAVDQRALPLTFHARTLHRRRRLCVETAPEVSLLVERPCGGVRQHLSLLPGPVDHSTEHCATTGALVTSNPKN